MWILSGIRKEPPKMTALTDQALPTWQDRHTPSLHPCPSMHVPHCPHHELINAHAQPSTPASAICHLTFDAGSSLPILPTSPLPFLLSAPLERPTSPASHPRGRHSIALHLSDSLSPRGHTPLQNQPCGITTNEFFQLSRLGATFKNIKKLT